MKESYDEGVATRIGPESCVVGSDPGGEALTGVRTGQPLSGENSVWGADALKEAEGQTGGRVSASVCPTLRRLRPWHVRTPPAREPGDLRHRPPSLAGRIGKAESRRR